MRNILILGLILISNFTLSAETFWTEDIATLKGYRVFEDLRMDWKGYTAANSLPLLPIGSFIQGNTKLAVNLMLAQLGGLLLYPLGLINSYMAPISIAGAVTFAISYFWQLIAPAIYSSFYNSKLREALGIDFIFDIDTEMVIQLSIKQDF